METGFPFDWFNMELTDIPGFFPFLSTASGRTCSLSITAFPPGPPRSILSCLFCCPLLQRLRGNTLIGLLNGLESGRFFPFRPEKIPNPPPGRLKHFSNHINYAG